MSTPIGSTIYSVRRLEGASCAERLAAASVVIRSVLASIGIILRRRLLHREPGDQRRALFVLRPRWAEALPKLIHAALQIVRRYIEFFSRNRVKLLFAYASARQSAMLAGAREHLAEEHALRRMNRRVRREHRFEGRHRASRTQQNPATDHLVRFAEVMHHLPQCSACQGTRRIRASPQKALGLRQSEFLGFMVRLHRAPNLAIGDLDPPAVEHHWRSGRTAGDDQCRPSRMRSKP